MQKAEIPYSLLLRQVRCQHHDLLFRVASPDDAVEHVDQGLCLTYCQQLQLKSLTTLCTNVPTEYQHNKHLILPYYCNI